MGIKELTELVDQVNAKYGKDLMIPPKKGKGGGIVNMPRFSSRSLELDVALGGGWPRGKICEVLGPESSGKTFLINQAIAEVTNQKTDNQAILIDEEGANSEEWDEKCLINRDNLTIFKSEYAEQALDVMELTAQSGEFAVGVLDSVAALVPKEEQEQSVEKQQYALTARLIGKAVRKLYSAMRQASVKAKLPTVFLINQIRIKVGIVFGNPETTPGGNAIKFASTIRVDIRKKEVKKDDLENVVAQVSKFTIIKNKSAPPFRTGEIEFFVDGPEAGQVNNFQGLINLLVKYELIEKSKGWYRSKLFAKPINGDKALNETLRQLVKNKQVDVLNDLIVEIEKKAMGGRKIEFRFK